MGIGPFQSFQPFNRFTPFKSFGRLKNRMGNFHVSGIPETWRSSKKRLKLIVIQNRDLRSLFVVMLSDFF